MLKIVVASSLLAAGAATAFAADAVPNHAGLSQGDRDFLNKAYQGGMMEVSAGKLASHRAQDPQVKAFGEKMVADHSAANDALKSLADSKQMPLTDSVAPDEHVALGKLEGLNGTDFDKTYAKMMSKDHVTDIDDFEKEVKKGQDPDVKAFAEQTLPTLRNHLMLANRLSSDASKSPKSPKSP